MAVIYPLIALQENTLDCSAALGDILGNPGKAPCAPPGLIIIVAKFPTFIP